MTVLYFPDLDTLQLSLTSGVVPPAVSQEPVSAAFDADGHVWLKASVALPRPVQNELRRLGVHVVKSLDAADVRDYSCWPQLIPLQREATPQTPGGQTPVLFELSGPGELPGLVSEILRLGNDRQGFRWVRDDSDSPVLLRVVGPPYYSLLRALDRDGQGDAPRAYLERSPRLWVEIGHTHPLLAQLKAPEGKIVLLRPPRDWVFLDDVPYRDVYDILEFALPAVATRWQDAALTQKLTVPLRLTLGGGQDSPELWVLREHAIETLDDFVRSADDQLLARLSFAVGEGGGRDRVIVLRVRPSRMPPPVLVLKGAQGFRPFLKLPNLFLPVGARLHPPLRRDAVRRLFADDPDLVTWLFPNGDATFTPENLPDNVFRPLTDWIDYVLDHNHVALNAWMQSMQFEFESFVCKDDQDPRQDKSKRPARAPKGGRKDTTTEVGTGGATTTFQAINKSRKKEIEEPLPELPRAEPSELQIQLTALERTFLDMEGGLDAPQRQSLWPRLALLNSALGNTSDATLCYVHALWEDSPQASQWARTWLWTENKGREQELPAQELDRILNGKEPSLADVRRLSACVVAAAHREPPPPEVIKRLRPIQEFLQQHEPLLPVRAAWLVGLALYRLSHGDVLALTRTRDRLLERLFKNGLSAELDLPTFLRFSGVRSSDRFRAFRDWLLPLPEKIRRWIHDVNRKGLDADPADTEAYANLILAYGLARLGEEQRARDLHARARKALVERSDVHSFLLEAFGHRIQQALEGKPPSGPLPPEQLEYLEHMERIPRYMVDRLRQHSRILEPHEKINPYRSWQVRYFDELGQKLAALPDIIERAELEKTVVGLLASTRGNAAKERLRRSRVVIAALGVAPRIGEAFAKEVLTDAVPGCTALAEAMEKAEPAEKANFLMEQADLLEKAIFVAAHFDQSAHVQGLVARFQSLLHTLHGASGGQAVDSLAGQCFRGLRKLGLRDEIHAMLGQMAEVVTGGRSPADLRKRKDWSAGLRTLLHVASGWYYFGMEAEARPVMEEARLLLYQGALDAREQTKLACAYAGTIGQAPVDLALQSIDEMFQKLTKVCDTFTTNAYYSLSQLDVVEAVVLAVVTEDFALGTMARRWLDDEEFLIRRRVHADVHALMGQAQL